MEKEKLVLIAVYGSLIEGLHNHPVIANAEYVGEFNSEPKFSMIDLGSFPAIVKEGVTSVKFHVYAVNEKTLQKVNNLEGFEEGAENNFYNRGIIKTPYGKAFYYYQNKGMIKDPLLVASGDWKDYDSTRVKTY